MKPGGGGLQSEPTSLVVQVNPSANIYGASPKKKTEEEDFEGIVERRPKFFKHLPHNYQVFLQDHNYCALPPSPTALISPKASLQTSHPNIPNGVTIPNGISRQQPPPLLAPPIPFFRSGYTRGVTPDPVKVVPPRVERVAEESDLSSDGEAPPGNTEDGEETETAPEDEDSVTRCICDFQHDDGYMICCDKCLVWQHVDCMGIERGNIPEEYRCEECEPRKVDKNRAIKLQIAKRSQFTDSSDSSSTPNTPPSKAGRNSSGAGNTRKGSSGGRGMARRRGERGGKAGRWRNSVENKRGKYSKPTAKQKQKKTGLKKNRESLSDKKDTSTSSGTELRSPSPSEGINQLRQWIDSYEEAVTNHYSPELRARISAIKVNGLHSELRLNSSLSATPKSKISLLPSGIKILITTAFIPANQAIIEVRGKYMLPKGGLAASASNNKHQYVFHHRISGPGSEVTEVQVDASTYGNDARFVRSSCTPNAEIRHCIEKGTLHLYIVSTTTIEPKNEITLPHRPGHGACASGDKCSLLVASPDKRRRGRRRTLSESSTTTKSSSISLNNNNKGDNVISTPKEVPPPPVTKRPPPPPVSPEPPVVAPKVTKVVTNSAPSPPLTRESSSKGTRGQVSSRRATTPAAKSEERKRNPPSSPPPTKKHDGKLTREERKMEAIMKAFERLEKDEQRKQTGTSTGRVRKSSSSLSPVREKQEKPQLLRKKISRETRTAKTLRPRRNINSKQQAPAPRRVSRNRRRAPSEETDTDESEGVSVGGSGPPTPGTPPLPEIPVYEVTTPVKEEDSRNQEPHNSSGSESTPPPSVSNTCLLVAAAVGPLAPGFKFPKTKKNFLNSWFGGGEVMQNDDVAQKPGLTPVDCAKKRWLRQAISEDSDSPKHELGSISSPTELAAPLKKRRFARESISSEMSYTPPETPQAVEPPPQIYEFDENSLEQNVSSGEVTPQNDLPAQPEIDQQFSTGNGPRTPPSRTSTADSTPVSTPTQTPQKPSSSPTAEITEEEKVAAIAKTKEEVARVKRKLSISEYRERVKSNPVKGSTEGNQTNQAASNLLNPLTSVDDIDTDSDDFLSNSLLFSVPPPPIEPPSFKKGPPIAGFNAAPTLVEQQREALTERLRREFGLLLSDDEEEKKKGLACLEASSSLVGGLPISEVKKKRRPPPPPPPPPLPPVGPPPPPPPPSNDWIYYHSQQSQQFRL